MTATAINSVAACVARCARVTPDATALVPRIGDPWTYSRLATEVEVLTQRLSRTVESEAPVAIVMTNEPESLTFLLAAERLGRPAVLLPPALTPAEMRAALQAGSPAVLAVPPGAQHVTALTDLHRSPNDGGRVQFSNLRQPSSPPLPHGSFICQLTSGSTGPSRLALRTSVAVQTEISAVAERLALESRDVVFCASSIAHSYGLIGGLLAPLLVGAAVILTSSATDVDPVSRDLQPTIIFGLAATYRSYLKHVSTGQTGADRSLQRVRFALSAGAPLPPGLFDTVSERLGVEIRQDYGTTETGTIAIDAPNAPTPGWVGKPLSHAEVRLSAVHQEIQIRSGGVASGYLSSGGLETCTTADGWYRTGDIGAMDNSGYLQVRDRLREPISTALGSVRPEVVERAIRELPGVREVVVLADGSAANHVAMKAVVVAPDLNMSAISAWCADRLPLEQRPSIIEMRDTLPRSPAGKILQKYM